MWLGAPATCAGTASVLLGFQPIKNGFPLWQKYAFNTLTNGLLLVLGIAFTAQFKQYCETMRWRFLASSYRTLNDFDEVLSCDSWRSTIHLIFRGKPSGNGYPRKSQILAAAWVFLFITFNVLTSLLGLTYSLEVDANFIHLKEGELILLSSVILCPKVSIAAHARTQGIYR